MKIFVKKNLLLQTTSYISFKTSKKTGKITFFKKINALLKFHESTLFVKSKSSFIS